MPTYEYICEICKSAFEIRASFQQKEAGLQPECPHCGAKHTRQVISAGMFVRSEGMTNFSAPGCGPNAGPGCCG